MSCHWPINSHHLMMTLKVLCTLCLLPYSIFPVTCWCSQFVSQLLLSTTYKPWSMQQNFIHFKEWPLKNVHQGRFPCCWESSGDFPSILEWSAQVLLQLAVSVAFIRLSCWALLLCLCLQLSVLWTRGRQTWEAHCHHRIFAETLSYGRGALSQSLYNHLLLSQENCQDPPPFPFYRKVRFPPLKKLLGCISPGR